jgi:nitroreductase
MRQPNLKEHPHACPPMPDVGRGIASKPHGNTSPKGTKVRLGALIALLLTSLSLTSCAFMERVSMRETEAFYLANSQEQFPAKPATFSMPTLSQQPQRSRPIGIFQFKTQKGRGFATQAAIYNARRVGADSLWVRGIQEWSEPYAFDVPEHWEPHYETVYRRRPITIRGEGGQPDQTRVQTVPETILRQIWVPTQHVSGFNHFTSIDAVMYRYR